MSSNFKRVLHLEKYNQKKILFHYTYPSSIKLAKISGVKFFSGLADPRTKV